MDGRYGRVDAFGAVYSGLEVTQASVQGVIAMSSRWLRQPASKGTKRTQSTIRAARTFGAAAVNAVGLNPTVVRTVATSEAEAQIFACLYLFRAEAHAKATARDWSDTD